MQCRPNVFDVGPTLHKVIQMFCVYWVTIQTWGSSSFQIPAVIQSVCLQVGDQIGQKTRALNYYLIDVAQVYMNLLWFENLLLMRPWVWNAYLVLLWNRALASPRALLPSGGPLSREFWQLTTPLTSTLNTQSYTREMFNHLKLCLATATQNFKWMKIAHIWLTWDH